LKKAISARSMPRSSCSKVAASDGRSARGGVTGSGAYEAVQYCELALDHGERVMVTMQYSGVRTPRTPVTRAPDAPATEHRECPRRRIKGVDALRRLVGSTLVLAMVSAVIAVMADWLAP
jgi:hypothetical protein